MLVAWDFLTTGSLSYPKIAGILTSHLYFFMDRVLPEQQGGRRYLNTPAWLTNLVPRSEAPRAAGFGAGGVEQFAPRAQTANTQAQGHSWGSGNRLGE